MYMCMSKCRRIAFRCPPKLRITLFKAYVVSHFTYACEVVPYSRKHVESMNKLILKFARWATGLPSHACSNAVLREAGLRPIEYDILQARMNYVLHIRSRPTSHATNLALDDIIDRSSTSSLFKWYKHTRGAFDKLACQSLFDNPLAFNANKSVIKQAVHECWLREGGGTAADIELASKYSYHLSCIRNDNSKFSNVSCMKLNVLASPACYIRMHVQITYMRKYDVKEWVHMNTTRIKRHEQEALSLFRTEVAPVFVNMKHSSSREVNRFSRVCEFCKYVHGEFYVNDAFHVLFKCPMMSSERIELFNMLDVTCGAKEWIRFDTLFDLGVALLSPLTVEVACAVGKFLCECLAAREILLASSPFITPSKTVTSCRWLGGRRGVSRS